MVADRSLSLSECRINVVSIHGQPKPPYVSNSFPLGCPVQYHTVARSFQLADIGAQEVQGLTTVFMEWIIYHRLHRTDFRVWCSLRFCYASLTLSTRGPKKVRSRYGAGCSSLNPDLDSNAHPCNAPDQAASRTRSKSRDYAKTLSRDFASWRDKRRCSSRSGSEKSLYEPTLDI